MIFMDHRRRRMYLLLIALLTLAMVASMELGSQPMGPGTLAKTLVGYGDEVRQMILLSFRLPRVVLALLVGMGVSVSGVLMQGVLRNDLAAPGVLGVSAGGNLGVVVALLIGGLQLASPWIVPGMSILGGLAALLLVCLLAADGDVTSPTKLLLMGVAVSAACGALTLILSLILSLNLDRQVYAYAVAWMSGSLGKADWNYVLVLAVWLAVLVPVAWCTAPMMNVLRLGDDTAMGLGLSVRQWRMLLLGLAVVLSAVSMAVAGSIVFLGLVAPHIARRLVGPNHITLIPIAALVGMLLLLLADTIGRTILAPEEIPAGVLVGILGGVYFLYLLMTTKG